MGRWQWSHVLHALQELQALRQRADKLTVPIKEEIPYCTQRRDAIWNAARVHISLQSQVCERRQISLLTVFGGNETCNNERAKLILLLFLDHVLFSLVRVGRKRKHLVLEGKVLEENV